LLGGGDPPEKAPLPLSGQMLNCGILDGKTGFDPARQTAPSKTGFSPTGVSYGKIPIPERENGVQLKITISKNQFPEDQAISK